jgi:hypothetical protein
VSLGRNRARPSCTARARPTATRAWPAFTVLARLASVANGHAGTTQLSLSQRSVRSPARPASAAHSARHERAWRHSAWRRRCTAASRRRLIGARETAGENVARLTEAWTAARHDGVDGGVGWHGERGRRWHGGSAMTSGELRGRVRGLARTEAQHTGGATHSPARRCRRRRRWLRRDGDGFRPGEHAASDSGSQDAAWSRWRMAVGTRREGRGELGQRRGRELGRAFGQRLSERRYRRGFQAARRVRTPPPTAANQGSMRPDTAADRRAPRVSQFLN